MNYKDRFIKWFKKTKQFIANDIWELNMEDLKGFNARLVKHIRIVLITARDFGKESLGLEAVSLSFFTTMSFVPFVAVLFSVTNGFGLDGYLKTLIYQSFTNQEIIDMVLSFADNIIKTAKEGPYGIISFLVFVWLIIWLMLNVERSFNKIWKVEKSRVIWKRILTYIGILILSPFIIILFLSMAILISQGIQSLGIELPFFSLSKILQWGIFYGFASILFAVMYMTIPNSKVRFSSAFKAALVSALAFTVIQYLYLETQIMVTRMNAVYGVFAAIPLFMVWVNTGWFIILIGSEISYAFQNVEGELKLTNSIKENIS